ncbi:MAG TPA: hypothetical protein VGR45_14610 [Stellaceae bacterium]|nr:hypothetical protein [Stellaceae bacterium]
MSCARKSPRQPRGFAGTVYGKPHYRLALSFLVVAGLTRAMPGAAQPMIPAPPGAIAPDILPPAPSGPFGLPNPLTPPSALPSGYIPASPQQPADTLALPTPGAGITTLQQYNPNAPAVLINPTAAVGLNLYDNVNFTHSDRTAAAEVRLVPGISMSADTPRLQGVLSAQVSANAYTPTSNLDQIYANLYGNGHATILPDRLFVDAQSSISQASTLPGLGFISPSLLPRTQQTQIFANSVSPYLRESYDGLVDTELRYRFGSTNFSGNTTATPSILTPTSTNLSSGILNEGSFIAATGQNFERALSRLTVDASEFSSNSASQNTQFNSYDDLQYRITPDISALGRIGYQNIRFPFAPEATFVGVTWLAGGRLAVGPNYGYISLEYGRQQGVYGFTGSAAFQVTPTISVSANLVQGISSPGQYALGSLATSTLSANGSIVDQYSGLPTAFYSPGLGLTNGVYRQHLFNGQVTDAIGPNSYSLYGYYENQQSLTPPITAPTKSIGAYASWRRDIRPDLNGYTSFGFSNTNNAVLVNSSTPINGVNSFSANVGVNYLLARNLSGSVLYTLTYQPNGATLASGRGDIVANTLQFLLTKAF